MEIMGQSESHLESTPHNNELQRTRPGFARSLAAELSVRRTTGRAFGGYVVGRGCWTAK
jgi:hypothetical protein